MRDKQAPHYPALAPGTLATDAPADNRWPAGQTTVARRVFPGHRDQVAYARRFVQATLGPVPVLDDAVLLVSELCTNALLHTASGRGGTFEVAIWLDELSVRVEVRDGAAPRSPTATQPAVPLSEDGRGLGLVELLADWWGHSGDQAGRSVFFELHWKQPD